MPRRRPPKHVREATRAARESGEELQLKPSERRGLASQRRFEALSDHQLSSKIAKAQMLAERNASGFFAGARNQNCGKHMLSLGISPNMLQGTWSDAAGNTVNVYPGENSYFAASFWVTLSRPCGPDINLTLRPTDGNGWYCGSARLDESRSTLTQLMWEFPNGTFSIWTRNLPSNGQIVPYGPSGMDYYTCEDLMPIERTTLHIDSDLDNLSWSPAPGQWISEDGKCSYAAAPAAASFQGSNCRTSDAFAMDHWRSVTIKAGQSTQAENTNGAPGQPIVEELDLDFVPSKSKKTPQPGTLALEDIKGARQKNSADTRNDAESGLATHAEMELQVDDLMEAFPWQDTADEPGGSLESSDKDDLLVVPHILTPVCDFHDSLITSPMCYVVMSKVQAQQLSASTSGARSSEDNARRFDEKLERIAPDAGTGEGYYNYAQGDYGDYADSVYGATSSVAGDLQGGVDDYDCELDHTDAGLGCWAGIGSSRPLDQVDADSQASRGTSSAKDDLGSSDPGKPGSEASDAAYSCPW